MAHSRCTITWEDALEDDRVQTLEDPLHKTATAKDVYDRLYGPFLETLDGEDMSSYFDFYFEAAPTCTTHWVFKDEDAREDFMTGCQDEGCLPTLKEVHEGEDKVDKERRKAGEAIEFDAETEEQRLRREALEREFDLEEAAEAEKLARVKAAERAMLAEKKQLAAAHAEANKREQMQKSLEKMRADLAKPDLPEAKRAALQAKVDRVVAELSRA